MENDTEALWRQRVREWKESGLTAREFARRGGFGEATLSTWKRRLAARPTSTPGTVTLARVTREADAGEAGVEIAAPSGWAVRVRPGFDPELLRAVLTIVREARG